MPVACQLNQASPDYALNAKAIKGGEPPTLTSQVVLLEEHL
jgi:hypothetical protein